MTTGAGARGGDASGAHAADDEAGGGGGDARDADDPELRAMRSVWLTMRDEDPPGGGMAQLMAAARAKAETMQVRPTLWQRLVGGLRRPPALALATVMVLVGGAVLFGRHAARVEVRGGVSRSVEPTADRAAPAVMAPPVPPPADRDSDVRGRGAGRAASVELVPPVPPPADREDVGGGGAGAAASVELAPPEPKPAIVEGHTRFAAPVAHSAASSGAAGRVDVAPGAPQAVSGDREGAAVGGWGPESAPDGSGAARSGRRREDTAPRGGAAPATGALSGRSPAADEPATAARSHNADQTSHDADHTAAAADAKERTAPTITANPAPPAHAPGLAPLYRQCESAAQRGECAVVKRLVEKITPADRGYRARLAKGSAVARCLAE